MSVIPDHKIRALAQAGMIEPFAEKQNSGGIISYGLSSYGYDARLANSFKIFHNLKSAIINPKSAVPDCFVEQESDSCIIPPNSYVLAHTVETFRIPRDVLVICLGKSTYARWGIIVNVTPLEPEWEGTVTLEISNATPCPVEIFANEGICQLIFLRAEEACEISYADRKGKYQGQTGITLGKVIEEKRFSSINGVIFTESLKETMDTVPRLTIGSRVILEMAGMSSHQVREARSEIGNLGMEFQTGYDVANNNIIIRKIL